MRRSQALAVSGGVTAGVSLATVALATSVGFLGLGHHPVAPTPSGDRPVAVTTVDAPLGLDSRTPVAPSPVVATGTTNAGQRGIGSRVIVTGSTQQATTTTRTTTTTSVPIESSPPGETSRASSSTPGPTVGPPQPPSGVDGIGR